MDSDSDGEISVNKINILSLDNQTIDIITPILLQIEENDLTLTLDQFLNLCEQLIHELDVTSKNYLIGPVRSHFKNEPEDPTFTPDISSKSKELAERSQN